MLLDIAHIFKGGGGIKAHIFDKHIYDFISTIKQRCPLDFIIMANLSLVEKKNLA